MRFDFFARGRLAPALFVLPFCAPALACSGRVLSTGLDDHGAPGPQEPGAKPPPADPPPPRDVLWTSDDGPILGLAVNRDRIFCVTTSKLTAMARDGTPPKVHVQSTAPFAYSGAIAVSDVYVYWGTREPTPNPSSGTEDEHNRGNHKPEHGPLRLSEIKLSRAPGPKSPSRRAIPRLGGLPVSAFSFVMRRSSLHDRSRAR
jgi:hypothetical protein